MRLHRWLGDIVTVWRRRLLGDVSQGRYTLHQVAALPVRLSRSGKIKVLLISTRGGSGKLIIPRGWPMPGKADFQAAALEAEQEAGVLGPVSLHPIGTYSYRSPRKLRGAPIRVDVYRLDVRRQVPSFKEQGQRQLRWVGMAEAARIVSDPGLAAIIRELAEPGA